MPPQGVRAWSVFGTIGLEGLSRSIAQLQAFDAAGKGTARRLTGLSTSATLLAGGLAAVGLAAVAVGVRGAQAFAEFDAAMTQSLAIMGDVDDALEDQLADRARQASREFNIAASSVAEGFFFLASAGLSARESLAAIRPVTAFAKAGMFDLATATDLLTDAQSALGLTIRDDAVANMLNMVRVSDALVKANTLANATVQQFSEALTNRAAAGLRLVNKELEEGLAVLAVFADQGIKGAEAGTRLDIVLRDLQRAAITNADRFEDLEISVFDANDQMRDMADIVSDLEGAFEGMSDKQRIAALEMLGFNFRSVQALLTLIGFSDQIRKYNREVDKAGGTTKDVAEKQLGTLKEEFGLLGKEIESFFISVGSLEEGGLRGAVRGITEELAGMRLAMGEAGDDALTMEQRLRVVGEAFRDLVSLAPFALFRSETLRELGQARQAIQDIDQLLESASKNLDKSIAGFRALVDAQAPDEVIRQADRINKTVLRQAQRVNESVRRAQEAAAAGRVEEARQFQALATQQLRVAIRLNEDLAALQGQRRDNFRRVSLDMLRLQAEIGEASKQMLLDRLREELAAELEGSERFIELRREVHEVERAIEAERAAAARKAERRREESLQRERAATQERVRLAEREMQLAIRTGEITLRERLRQIQLFLAVAELTAEQRIELEEELFEITSRLTREQINQARALAQTNAEAARQVLMSWRETLSQLGAAFPALLDEIDEGMEAVGDEARDSIRTVGEDIENEAEALGRNIIAGIIRGGQSVSGILERAFEQILTTAILQVGTKLLGIGSPSRVTFAWGRDIGRGMFLGLRESEPAVQRASERLARLALPDRMRLPEPALPSFRLPPAPARQVAPVDRRRRDDRMGMRELVLRVEAPVERRPTDFLRDAEWQEAIRNTILIAEDQGFRLRGD